MLAAIRAVVIAAELLLIFYLHRVYKGIQQDDTPMFHRSFIIVIILCTIIVVAALTL